MSPTKRLIKGGRMFFNGRMLDNPFLKIEGKTIIDAGTWNEIMDAADYKVIELDAHQKIVPGFIDIHIHGANGADVMDATPEALDKIAQVLPREGGTSFLATTITSGKAECEKALTNVSDYIRTHQKPGNAEVLGVHLEGPFLNPARAGAEPGVVGAALLHDGLMAEIIVDGLHVNPEVVKLAYRQKGKDGLILITDAMRAKHAGEGDFELGGQKVMVKDGMAKLEDGTLAGSVLTMNDAVKNSMEFTGCSLEEAITMAAVNPAKQLNISKRKGNLSIGKDADIVILDKDNSVVATFCKGTLSFGRADKQK